MNNKSGSERGEHLVRIILEDFHSRLVTVIKNTVEHEQRFHNALDVLANDINQLLIDADKKSAHLQKLCEEQRRDIEVYRGALGYSVSGDTPTKTHDGFVPVCGMCDARQKQIEKQRDTLDAIKEAIGGASSHPETGVSIVDDVRDLKAKVEEQKMFLESCVQYFEEGRSPIGTPWFKGLKKMTNKNQDAPQMAEPFDRSWYGMWRAAMTTIEEQKGEIERLQLEAKTNFEMWNKEVNGLRSQLAHLNLVLEGYKLMAGLSDHDPIKIQGMIQKQIEEQRVEIAKFKQKWADNIDHYWCDCKSNDSECAFEGTKVCTKHILSHAKSQLATQTERVRQAEALLRSAHRWLPDNLMTLSGEPNTKERIYAFLKQESLGDGGKGE